MQVEAESAAPLRVFLVEDSPAVLERLEAMLEDVAARDVGHASGAQDAIRRILAERPDLVVLDLRLAEGSGFDVLMLTNFASEPYRRMAERLGARGFYDKTTEFDGVRAALEARAHRLH